MDLLRLATDLSEIYMQNDKVEGVLLGGSVARNWQDEYSDIELFVFWKESPNDEDRKSPINDVNGRIIDYCPYEEEEWSETYITQGVKLEISNFLTNTIYRILDEVVLNYDTDFDKQCLAATVYDGVSLAGEDIIDQLKKKVEVYPEELGSAMIRENLDLGNRWSNREALLAREDWLMLYKVVTSVQSNIMGMLFGLNRLYVHHPAFKWQKRTLERMKVAPKKISISLPSVFMAPPEKSIRELEGLLQEIYGLVHREHPEIDLAKAIERTSFVRPQSNKSL
ncbi:DUF4037 domain-containing protein [Sediminibacillus halophilus]|uniref:DUF4037 domain-containing protein n=1 Tax=Sediminibacillus halophilus TaxID=482461 RepID=A0A1G9V3T5_9BACI|nr:DUF4037 domain-containing protein [Sediminibacillus halophilus]SDM66809.1 protein of unknown function [Sediminibacillus halophilus]